MYTQKLNKNWNMRRVRDEDFQTAVVPGTVYTDLLRNGKDNEDRALKLMDEDYEYRATFDCEKEVMEAIEQISDDPAD